MFEFLKKNSNNNEFDILHVICELANLILKGQKLFDFNLERFFVSKEIKNNFRVLFIDFHSKNEKIFNLEITKDRIFLINNKDLSLYKKYIAAVDIKDQGEIYGELMGFPKTATIAWKKDFYHLNNKRSFLLNNYSQHTINFVLGDIFKMGYLFSKDNWETEFKSEVKKHMKIYETFSDIFLKKLNKRKRVKLNLLKKNIKKKKLFNLLNPIQKAIFLACENDLLNEKEKHELVFQKLYNLKD